MSRSPCGISFALAIFLLGPWHQAFMMMASGASVVRREALEQASDDDEAADAQQDQASEDEAKAAKDQASEDEAAAAKKGQASEEEAADAQEDQASEDEAKAAKEMEMARNRNRLMCQLKRELQFDVMPDPSEDHNFSTCAVVSSSGQMLNFQWGADIDRHSTVFRFNDATTAGFEEHVGSKESIRFLQFRSFEKLQGHHVFPNAHFFWIEPFYYLHKDVPLRILTEPSVLAQDDATMYQFMPGPPTDKIMTQMHRIFNSSYWKQRGVAPQVHHPGSGMFALIVALQLCDSIDAYMMTDVHPSAVPRGYHYYDTLGPSVIHDSEAIENKVWAMLSTTPEDEMLSTGRARLEGFSTVDCEWLEVEDLTDTGFWLTMLSRLEMLAYRDGFTVVLLTLVIIVMFVLLAPRKKTHLSKGAQAEDSKGRTKSPARIR